MWRLAWGAVHLACALGGALVVLPCSAQVVVPPSIVEPEEPKPIPASQLMLVDPDGTNLRVFAAFAGRNVGSPQFSPDGTLLAYDTWTDEFFSDTQIEVATLDGKVQRRLGRGAMPSWSPDGSQIVCHTYDSPQSIVVMDIEGEGRETIMLHWGSPRWSRVGQRIVSAMATRGISVFNLATGGEVVVAPNFSLWQGQSVSPDGRMIVFGERNGGVCLATLNDDATRATVRWIVRSGQSYHSGWSKDGKTVVFEWRPTPEAPQQLYLFEVDSTEAPRLLPGQDPAVDNRDVSWSPDGKTIIFVSTKVR
ncbi:MAG TPA: hypothetical protein VEQ85_02095 [Lacipirellulaceae bacterium]|nr:hypothetical protein [Lacipirellulaceae bacterium]